jgi:hypothetical protein
MAYLAWLILVSGVYPLGRAWRANRRTTLLSAVHWSAAAWLGWCAALLERESGAHETLVYLALCLTSCAGIAVLGARRPVVGAWNFVVLGLLCVLLLQAVEGLYRLPESVPRVLFLVGTLAAGFLNYLPTRLGMAAVLLAAGCGVEVWELLAAGYGPPVLDRLLPASWIALALAPWAAFLGVRARRALPSEFDRLWLTFRDRFGLVWAQRVREQFNHSAANARWPVVLRWRGLRLLPGTAMPGEATQAEIVSTLRAMLRRFGPGKDRAEPKHQ